MTTAAASSNIGTQIFQFSTAPVICVILAIIAISWFWRRHRNRNDEQPLLNIRPPTPIISERIDWDCIVSYGQFGCVWKANYLKNVVAIKIIQAHEKSTWITEKNIYELDLKHENILTYFGAEKRLSDSNLIQYCIITQYHAIGSLADYLSEHQLTLEGMFKLALTLTDGLAFLHKGAGKKPAIAHRDLKSRNVLVKDDLTCCLGDFGSACQLSSQSVINDLKAQVCFIIVFNRFKYLKNVVFVFCS